jgi:protein O-GlcNAc transferase
MNRSEKRRNQKISSITTKKAIPAQKNSPMHAEQEQNLTIQQAINLGLQYHQATDLPKAESVYQQILQVDPDQPIALHLLGVIAYQVGENNISVDLIAKAIAIKPDLVEGHSNLGNTLQELGRLDEAVASYKKAINIKPDYAEAHYNLGNAFEKLGRLNEAMSSFKKAISFKKGFNEALEGIGNVLMKKGKHKEGLNKLRLANGSISFDPTNGLSIK